MRVGERDVTQGNCAAEQVVASGLVHIVALETLKHDTKSTAQDRLSFTSQVIGEAQSWTPVIPVVIHQSVRNPWSHTRNAKPICILQQPFQLRIWTRCQARTSRSTRRVGNAGTSTDQRSIAIGEDRRIGRVVKIGVEVRHLTIDLGGMWNAIPTQAEIESQTS